MLAKDSEKKIILTGTVVALKAVISAACETG